MPQKMSPPDETAGGARVRQRRDWESPDSEEKNVLPQHIQLLQGLPPVLTLGKEERSRGDKMAGPDSLQVRRRRQRKTKTRRNWRRRSWNWKRAQTDCTKVAFLHIRIAHCPTDWRQFTWTRVSFFLLRREPKKKKKSQLLSQFVQQSRYQELRNRTKSAINVKEIS